MNTMDERNDTDPLRLSELPLLEPVGNGWDEIRQALEAEQASGQQRRRVFGWVAMAASLVLVVGLAVNRPVPQDGDLPVPPANTSTTQIAGQPSADDLNEAASISDLIAMSQLLEGRLRTLRDSTGALPAQSATYIAELEDLVARVDGQLSFSPDSVDLWGQRVNLLMDLEMIYQHHWEREYGRMASL